MEARQTLPLHVRVRFSMGRPFLLDICSWCDIFILTWKRGRVRLIASALKAEGCQSPTGSNPVASAPFFT